MRSPGTPAGLEDALERFGSLTLGELAAPAARLAREGHVVVPEQAFFLSILAPILTHYPEAASIYAPGGSLLGAGDTIVFADLADALERLGDEGAEPFYRGEVAAAISDWVLDRGGTLGRGDFAAYESIAREPVRARFRGREVLTNPPPSSGGILIAYALSLLERRDRNGLEDLVEVMRVAQDARTEEFLEGLYVDRFASRFLDQPPGAGRLGSTTHITAVDGDGRCASVTCSNGTGSGLVVPGTGVHVNNMLGEEDLNPHGFHRQPAGRRMPSMMSPTVVLADGALEAGLGSGGSNRIRSAILQTIVRLIGEGLDVEAAVVAPRVHYEEGSVQAEPGVDEAALARLAAAGCEVVRWPDRNVFFGGVHAVARDPGAAPCAAPGTRAAGARSPPPSGPLDAHPVRQSCTSPTITLPFSRARSAISRERATARTSSPRARASTLIRSGSDRSSSSRCLVGAGSSTRAAIP